MFKRHKLSPIDRTDIIRKLPKCKAHALNDLEFFCTTDEIGVCQVCLLKGNFVGKPYTLVSELKEKRAESIQEKIADVELQRQRLVSARDDASAVASELVANLSAQRDAVSANFQSIREALLAREKATLGALDDLKNAKCRVLQKQIESITSAIAKMDAAKHEGDVVLNYSNDLEYVYNSYVIEEYFQDVAAVVATSPSPCAICASSKLQCHCPVVDSELPVVISERVPELVAAYAAVPPAHQVDALLSDEAAVGSPERAKKAMNVVGASDEQKLILQRVASGAADNADEYGCVVS